MHRPVIPDHTVVTGQGQFKSAAQCRAVDRRRNRHRQLFQATHDGLGGLHTLKKLLRGIRRDLAQHVQVATGEKGFLGRCQHDTGEAFLRFQFAGGVLQQRQKFLAHGIHGASHIHGDSDDAIGIFLVIESAHFSDVLFPGLKRAR